MTHDEFEDRIEAFARGDREAYARLASLAAADPALAEKWADLEPALRALAGARPEPLPEGLHDTLLLAARTAHAPRRLGRVSWFSFITAALQVRPAYALGGALAAGIAIGALGLALISGSAEQGLRSARQAAPGATASLPPAPAATSPTRLDLGTAHVELISRPAEGGLVVRVEARGEASTLTLTWDEAAVRLSGLRWETPQAPAFESAPGLARLPIPLASGCELSFSPIAPGGSAVRVTLGTAGSETQDTLRWPR